MANRIPVAAHDTVEALREKMKKSSDVAYKQRLKIIIAAKAGTKHKDIADRLMISTRSVSVWIGRYNKRGSEALKTNKGGRPGGNPIWDASLFEDLAKEIDKGGYWSIPRMQAWFKEHKHKDIPEQTVWYRMDKLGYSYKSARPHPVQGNREKQDAFKKGASPRSWSR
jgi:transposase